MAYQKQTWEDLPSTNTPINAERLNHIEEGIANAVETDSVARVTNVVSRNKAGLKEIAWLQSMDYINTTSNGVKYKAKAEQYAGFNLILNKSLEIGKEYTISFKNSSSDNITFSITKTNTGWQNDYDNSYIKSHSVNANASYSYTFTAVSNIVGIMFICSTVDTADTNERNIIDIQLEKGSTATPYTPYLNMQELQENRIINFKDALISGTSDANGFIETSIPEKANILSCKLTNQDGMCLPYVHKNGNFSFKCTDWNFNSFATQSLTIYVVYMDN